MQSNDKQIKEVILRLLEPALGRSSFHLDDLEPSFNLVDSGLFDSIEFLEFIARIEQHTGVALDLYDVDPDRLTTVGGLIALTQRAAPDLSLRSIGNE